MSLFKRQIEEIVKTLKLVRDSNEDSERSFNMGYWHTSTTWMESQTLDVITECGYVACICGHQAVRGDLSMFSNNKTDYRHLAEGISEDLDESCRIIYDDNSLALSIYDDSTSCRRNNAEWTGLLTDEQMEHPHLTTDSSLEYAISYLEMIIEILEEL